MANINQQNAGRGSETARYDVMCVWRAPADEQLAIVVTMAHPHVMMFSKVVCTHE